MTIKQLFLNRDYFMPYDKLKELKVDNVTGWVRTCRTSSNSLGFCNINDGTNVSGLQIVISDENMEPELIENFFHTVKLGSYINCSGKLVLSPAKGQKYEMKLSNFKIIGKCEDSYPLCKNRMNLETLRNFYHLRARTNVFGSIFRIRSKLMKIIHDFYHEYGFLHLDPNIITINECEGGAGVFQLTEKDITYIDKLDKVKDSLKYDWSKDHFNKPAYLTVSSQLQLECMACCLGNVYTMNKSFRSEHSSTNKHLSEFTHLEIEIINNSLDDLMNFGENMIKYCITNLLTYQMEDLENLNKFTSKGLIDKLKFLEKSNFKKIKYIDLISEINNDILKNKKIKLTKMEYGEDLSSEHENYITKKYNNAVFVTHWPIEIKSFYMKQLDDETCESFDLLMPYSIGELIGGSQREDNYEKLHNMMKKKNIDIENMKFYLELRKYGSCPHGGFGLGFDRLLMLMTGIANIRDVIPFPVNYKSCKY